MSGFLIYVLWVQVFVSFVSIVFTFKIGKLKFTPSNQWFTFSASLFLSWLYRVFKLCLLYTDNPFIQKYGAKMVLFSDLIILPSVSILIMIFTLQIYKLVKNRQ